MKTLIVISVIASALIFSCGTIVKDEVQEFIPGTYVRQSEGEFGTSYDTLVIAMQNETAREYKIERRWKYDRVVDEKVLEPEYKITNATGIYDADKKLLQETQSLNIYTFDVKNKFLNKGTNQFTKIE
ncbi:MAG: hypothetical protein ACN4EP_01185 [Sediminibacterium sp.]